MNDKSDAAFPTTSAPYAGLTKRDYFAAMAMQGIAANSSLPPGSAKERAECAYFMADAMLKERNKNV